MDYSTSGFPVLHYFPEFAQTHVHWVDDAIQLSHPVTPFSLCSQSFPASASSPMSWLFPSGGQSIRASTSILPMKGWFTLGLIGLVSLLSKGLSRVMAAVTVCSDFGAQENTICHYFHFFPHLLALRWWDQMLWLSFWMLHFKLAFSFSSFSFMKRLLVPLHSLSFVWYHLHIWGYQYFSQQS